MSSLGYTLVELLVVMAIMVIVGVFAFANFKDFSQDQIVNQASEALKSFFRIAQSSATSSTVCEGIGGVSWAVNFLDSTKIQLVCGPEDKLMKTLNLDNARIVGIKCSAEGVSFDPPLKISYAPLTGNVVFSVADETFCPKTATQLFISLDNAAKPGHIKSFTVSKGGVIQDVP